LRVTQQLTQDFSVTKEAPTQVLTNLILNQCSRQWHILGKRILLLRKRKAMSFLLPNQTLKNLQGL